MMKLYSTAYSVGGLPYYGQIEASDRAHAQHIALARRLGERVGAQARSPEVFGVGTFIQRGDLVAALHEATFLCFVGLSAEVLSVREVVGDEGLLHELTHLLAGDPAENDFRRNRLMRMASDFERRVPGWPTTANEVEQ